MCEDNLAKQSRKVRLEISVFLKNSNLQLINPPRVTQGGKYFIRIFSHDKPSQPPPPSL